MTNVITGFVFGLFVAWIVAFAVDVIREVTS